MIAMKNLTHIALTAMWVKFNQKYYRINVLLYSKKIRLSIIFIVHLFLNLKQ